MKVNPKMTTDLRVVLLRYAHRNGISLNERLEWQIDEWMAQLRNQFVIDLVTNDENSRDQFVYLSRRHNKTLGLLLNVFEEPYDPNLIMEKYRNLNNLCALVFHNISKTEKLDEEALISYLITKVGQSAGFKSLAANLIGQGDYFEKDNPQQLTRNGARALLFSTGYLQEDKIKRGYF
ncbi:MAG: hypothetical protein H0U49_10110 [Parachlamydiaceae bacterium]|nr:hypothetical protein [Parachlamydiaceae bacterium]